MPPYRPCRRASTLRQRPSSRSSRGPTGSSRNSKAISGTIPNQGILINTLALQEAKDSSAIENIVTTHDELFRAELWPEGEAIGAAKEVRNYSSAIARASESYRAPSSSTTGQER